jgi:hypothetical protein
MTDAGLSRTVTIGELITIAADMAGDGEQALQAVTELIARASRIRSRGPGDTAAADNAVRREILAARGGRCPCPVPLAWHRGRHAWAEHDGYPRHQHSGNGVLTIALDDTRLHVPDGRDFS